MPSDNYPYAVGRIRIIENSLLGEAKLARLRELEYWDAAKQLADWGFAGDYPLKTDVDGMIAFERAAVRNTITDVTPQPELSDLFYVEFDAANLKLALKCRLLGTDIPDDQSEQGIFSPQLLRECALHCDWSALPAPLPEKLEPVAALMEKRAAQQMCAAVDSAFYAYVLAQLCALDNKLCLRYFTAKIDFTNILSALRARALKWTPQQLRSLLLEGGELEFDRLCASLSLAGEALPKALSFGEYADRIALAVSAGTGSDISAASAAFSALLLAIIDEERYEPFSIGPIASYLLRAAKRRSEV